MLKETYAAACLMRLILSLPWWSCSHCTCILMHWMRNSVFRFTVGSQEVALLEHWLGSKLCKTHPVSGPPQPSAATVFSFLRAIQGKLGVDERFRRLHRGFERGLAVKLILSRGKVTSSLVGKTIIALCASETHETRTTVKVRGFEREVPPWLQSIYRLSKSRILLRVGCGHDHMVIWLPTSEPQWMTLKDFLLMGMLNMGQIQF